MGGKSPKTDKGLLAAQKRQMAAADAERAELEAEKAEITGLASRARAGRGLLSFRRRSAQSSLGT